MTVDELNHQTETDEKSKANGYAIIHRLAHGSDTLLERPGLMEDLLKCSADIELRTREKPHNTAVLLAAGQGCGQTLLVLEKFKADFHAVNSDGLGILQAGVRCSSTVTEIAWRHGVQRTYSKKTKRTERHSLPLNKNLRYSTSWREDTSERKYPFKRYPQEASSASKGPAAKQHRSSRSGQWRGPGKYAKASSPERKPRNPHYWDR